MTVIDTKTVLRVMRRVLMSKRGASKFKKKDEQAAYRAGYTSGYRTARRKQPK